MKWLPFLLLVLFSCKNKTVTKQVASEKIREDVITYNDTVTMPSLSDPWVDSGYYRGYIPVEIDSLEYKDTTQISRFLSNTIIKKDIVLLKKQTLSHSVFIDQRKKIRMDTLKNSQVTIISKYVFAGAEKQWISINGAVIKDYKLAGVDSQEEEDFDLDEHSFLHFSFKEKEYYYIQAGAFYSFGASMGNVCYHLVYSLENKKLSYFMTCRFNEPLFGDVNGDNDLDYLNFDNSDFCTTVPYSDNVTIQLYSCNSKGDFVLQRDSKGNPFYIEGKTGYGFSQDSFNVKRSYWPFQQK